MYGNVVQYTIMCVLLKCEVILNLPWGRLRVIGIIDNRLVALEICTWYLWCCQRIYHMSCWPGQGHVNHDNNCTMNIINVCKNNKGLSRVTVVIMYIVIRERREVLCVLKRRNICLIQVKTMLITVPDQSLCSVCSYTKWFSTWTKKIFTPWK